MSTVINYKNCKVNGFVPRLFFYTGGRARWHKFEGVSIQNVCVVTKIGDEYHDHPAPGSTVWRYQSFDIMIHPDVVAFSIIAPRYWDFSHTWWGIASALIHKNNPGTAPDLADVARELDQMFDLAATFQSDDTVWENFINWRNEANRNFLSREVAIFCGGPMMDPKISEEAVARMKNFRETCYRYLSREIHWRTNTNLISVLNALGDSFFESGHRMKVVRIPAGVEVKIEEYAPFHEQVVEVARVWR